MRAVGFERYGGPEVLGVVDIPEPRPGDGEIRVRVAAATVNPADALFRSGGVAGAIEGEPPYVAGLELAGVVDAAGPGALWEPGERVAAMTAFIPSGRGAHAELVVVHGESAAPVPDGADLTAWATLPMNGLTARLALDRLGLSPGDTLLVTGAAGALGGYAVEIGKADGLRVVAVAAAADEELVRRLGADVLVERGENVAERVRERFPGGVDGVVDAALLGAAIVPAIRDGGSFAAVRSFDPAVTPPSERGISVEAVSVRQYLRAPEKLASLARLAGEGRLTLRVAQAFAPERGAEAFELIEAGGVRGRPVLVF